MAFRANLVGNGKCARHLVALYKIDDALRLIPCLLCKGLQCGWRSQRQQFKQARPTQVHLGPVDIHTHTAPLNGLEAIHARQGQLLLLGGGANGPRNDVFRIALGGGGQRKQSILLARRLADHSDKSLLPGGERARLVEEHSCHLARLLQRQAVAHKDAVLRALARADGNHKRHRQPQRVGTGDDKHRDDTLDCAQLHTIDERPNDECGDRCCERHIEEQAGGTVGKKLRR